MEMIWVFLLLQAIICGFLAMNIAKHKGHSTGAWFSSGFFFGIFGLVAAAGLPTKRSEISASWSSKKCPDCAEYIRETAKVCRYCGYRFISEENTSATEVTEIKFPSKLKVISDDVLFYSEAHNKSEIIKKLQRDEYVIAIGQLGEFNEWLKVKILDKVGYILKCDVST